VNFCPWFLNGFILSFNTTIIEQFLPVPACELAPGNRASLTLPQQSLARSEIRHPDIVPAHRHVPTAKASGKYPQAVNSVFNW
jgi:hypothetical protein